MADPDDPTPTSESTSESASESTSPPGIPELLLALQAVDTQTDQLGHRREHSPLRDGFDDATATVRTWEGRRNALRSQIDELGAAIESAEARGAELTTHRQRLERQLKTVIAPREAEALLHELTTIAEEVDELDLRELEALEAQAAADDDLGAHGADEAALREGLQRADEALASELAAIDAEVLDLADRREQLREQLPDALLATYDRKRAAFGVAVAPLVGKQCQGCHLDLSAAEIDTVRADAADSGVTDCPDCGRLLIV